MPKTLARALSVLVRRASFQAFAIASFTAFATLACTTEVEVTFEVEKPVTRYVEVTRENEVMREVEVTREVEATRLVQATREVEVTRLVEATREIEVTRLVQVTREVEVLPYTLRLVLCADYPYMVALGELQLAFFNAQVSLAERAVSGPVEEQKAARDWFANRVSTTRSNQVEICGRDLEPFGNTEREMRSLEGIGICTDTIDLLLDLRYANPDWDDIPMEVGQAWSAMMEGYISYCDNDYVP